MTADIIIRIVVGIVTAMSSHLALMWLSGHVRWLGGVPKGQTVHDEQTTDTAISASAPRHGGHH